MADRHSKAPRAQVATVLVGIIKLEGIMTPDGEFFVALPQVSDLFAVPQKNASRDIKALLGNGFQFLKVNTVLNPKAVNVLSLEWFNTLVYRLAFNGNRDAQTFVESLGHLGLYQRFCDTFGRELEAQERQAFLELRMQSIATRNELEDAIAWYCRTHEVSDNYAKFIYINATQALWKGTHGKIRKAIAEEYGLTTGGDLRSVLTSRELNDIERVESVAAHLILNRGFEPVEAVNSAIDRIDCRERYSN